MVTKPMRGSLSSTTASDSTCRTASLTRRMRSVIERDYLPVDRPQLEGLTRQEALRPREQLLHVTVAAGDARERDPGALPELVMVDLGNRGPEPALQLSFHRQQLFPLSFQRSVLGKVELGRQDSDISRSHTSNCSPCAKLSASSSPSRPRRSCSQGPRKPSRPRSRRERCTCSGSRTWPLEAEPAATSTAISATPTFRAGTVPRAPRSASASTTSATPSGRTGSRRSPTAAPAAPKQLSLVRTDPKG